MWQRLAAFVDEKMRAAAESSPTGDSLPLAVLAALNIADELFRCRDATRRSATAASPSAPRSSERLLDRVVDGLRSGQGLSSLLCA